jgi:hypothetical protein
MVDEEELQHTTRESTPFYTAGNPSAEDRVCLEVLDWAWLSTAELPSNLSPLFICVCIYRLYGSRCVPPLGS